MNRDRAQSAPSIGSNGDCPGPRFTFLVVLICTSFGCGRGDPMKVTVIGRDPQMAAASAQALAQITNCLAAMRSPTASQSNFVVCADFPAGGVPESLWIGHLEQIEGGFRGVVATPPGPASSLTNGQPVNVSLSNVTDWAYLENGKLIGGFTLRVLRSRMTTAERQSYDANLPYKIE